MCIGDYFGNKDREDRHSFAHDEIRFAERGPSIRAANY